jgi:hypothetical protein
MADPTERLFDGLDAPRPLPPELRERLAEQLLSGAGATDTAPLPLGAELDERLRTALTDPVAELLAGLDAPRPLPDPMRARLAGSLQAGGTPARRRRRGSWPAGLVGAAAVAVLVVAIAVLSLSGGGRHGNGRPSAGVAGPNVATQPSGETGGASGGTTTAGGGTSGSAPLPSNKASRGTGNVAGGVPGSGNGTSSDTTSGAAITSAEPSAGPVAGGTTVTIHGRGFATASGISFGPRVATAYTVVSDTTIRARTPASATAATVDIVVSLRSGSSSRLPSAFSYLPRPRVDGISPSSGTIHGGTWVTVSGAALRRTAQVQFGDTVAPRIEVVSDTRLRVLSPQHLPGPVDITVTTPGGTSPAGSRDRFTYLP